MKKTRLRQHFPPVSIQSISVLVCGSLIVLLQLGYIAFDIFSGTPSERFYAIQLYRACFDHILLEIVILVGGAFLFDVVIKDMQSDS